jgi:hypothetical protein
VIILKGVRMKYVSKLVLLAMAVALIGRAAEAQGNGRFDGVDCVRAGDDGRGQACADVSCEDSNPQWPGLNDCEGSQSQVFLRNIPSGAGPAAAEGAMLYDAQDVQGMIEAATDGMYTQEQAADREAVIHQVAFEAGVERGREDMGLEVRESVADMEAEIYQVAFDAGMERGRVEMGQSIDQLDFDLSLQNYWLDEVESYCDNSTRCQDALESLPYMASWPMTVMGAGINPRTVLARWVGHDEDRAAAYVLWIRSNRPTCDNGVINFQRLRLWELNTFVPPHSRNTGPTEQARECYSRGRLEQLHEWARPQGGTWSAGTAPRAYRDAVWTYP